MFLTKMENTTDINLAMEVAGHDFEVEKQTLLTERGTVVPDHVGIINTTNQQYLGTVGKGWEPVQPKVIYELADELIKATDGSINGVFNMFGGSVIGISFELAEREYVAGDPTKLNFLMLTSFNGMHGIAGHSTTNRLVCMNQCNTSNKVYNLKHTKYVANRLDVVKNMLKYYKNEITNFDRKMEGLVKHSMNDQEAITWFRSLFPAPKTQQGETGANNREATFVDCLLHGEGSNIAGVRGTSYGAFQALTEFINHHRTVRVHNDREAEEVKFQTIHFGTGNTLAQKGLNTIATSFEFSEDEFMLN